MVLAELEVSFPPSSQIERAAPYCDVLLTTYMIYISHYINIQSSPSTDLVVVGDQAMLTHIHPMFKAEQVGHLPLRTLAQTHGLSVVL